MQQMSKSVYMRKLPAANSLALILSGHFPRKYIILSRSSRICITLKIIGGFLVVLRGDRQDERSMPCLWE